MTTFKRICIRDHQATDAKGQVASVTRGKEYLTSAVEADGYCTVFGRFWWPCPVSVFAGEEQFT